MAESNSQQSEEPISGYYENYSETQKVVLSIELRKARNSLFTIALILLASDLVSLIMLDVWLWQTIIALLLVPSIVIGLAFLAPKEPVTAIVIAGLVIFGVWIYVIVRLGPRAIVSGWLVKAAIIYFLIAGLNHAKEAMRIKKELGV